MGLELVRAIQQLSNPFLDIVFSLATMLGEKMILAGVFCAIYWCFSRRMGRYLMFSLCGSLCLNGVVKDFFKLARPIGEEGVISHFVETATGHSFPSGHAQSATTFWWGAALWLKKRWIKVAALLIIIAVAFSRVYFGVHYPRDVIVGMILGLVVSGLFYRLVHTRDGMWVIVPVCAVLAATSLLTGESEDTISAGVMTLCVFGGIAFEARFVRGRDGHGFVNRAMRLFLGAVVAGAAYLLPKLLLPDGIVAGSLAVGLVAFVAMGVCPWLFMKLRW